MPDNVSSWKLGHFGQYSRTSRTISHLRQAVSQRGKYFFSGTRSHPWPCLTLDVEQHVHVIRILSILGNTTSRTGQFLLFSPRISHLRKYLIPDRVSAQIMFPLGPYLIPGRWQICGVILPPQFLTGGFAEYTLISRPKSDMEPGSQSLHHSSQHGEGKSRGTLQILPAVNERNYRPLPQ